MLMLDQPCGTCIFIFFSRQLHNHLFFFKRPCWIFFHPLGKRERVFWNILQADINHTEEHPRFSVKLNEEQICPQGCNYPVSATILALSDFLRHCLSLITICFHYTEKTAMRILKCLHRRKDVMGLEEHKGE